MIRWLPVLCLVSVLSLTAAEPTPGPLPADRAAKDMVLPDGFRAQVFAAEPDVVQPVSFTLDSRGRVWVAEALNYGTWKETGKDRITILEDTDGDGKADKRTVFYEGFNYITGLEVGFGGVWVVSPPRMFFIPDRDGDDKPDAEPTVLFDGFGYKESRHNLVNGFTWGPDGWLYFGHGRTTPSDVGKPGTPAGQRIHCDGGVCRVHPTKLIFENFADGTTNPWGVDFDDFGACFVSNCVNPHLFHMIQGGHYEPWRNRPLSQFAYDRLPTIADHLHYPGNRSLTLRGAEVLELGGGHAHCGTLIYLGDRFPAQYRNTAFMCNVHGRRINNDILRRKGSGYTASHGKDFMIAADPWFMGVTLRTGPDGNLFVSDWSDTGECHTYKPHTQNGRIYKISYGDPVKPGADPAQLRDAELVQLQLHRNDWHVRHARRLLQERAAKPGWQGQEVHATLHRMLAAAQLDEPQRLRALWALHVTGGIDADALAKLLDDRSEHVRAWAVQLLCESAPPRPEILTRFAALAKADPAQLVRLRLASTLQRLPLAARWPIAAGLVSHADDATDANLPLMNWYGIEPLVPADPARAMRLATASRIPLVCEYIARRLVDDALAQGAQGDLQPLVAALPDARSDVQLSLLQGAREALRGRKNVKMPAGWPAAYVQLARSANARIREHVIVLALAFGDPQALADLRKTAVNGAAAAADRQVALQALIDNRAADLAPTLHDLLADRALRRIAVRGLAAYPHPATAQRLLAVYHELSADEKHDAIATLTARKDSALALLTAVEKQTVARAEVSAYAARQIHALGDKEVTAKLRTVWGEVREASQQKQEQLKRYQALLTPANLQRADLPNGRLLYSKTCQQCHKLFGEGGTIGPDLTGANRAQLDYLLANLVDPSSEVAQDYRMSIVATADGRVITGILLERSPTRVIVQTATDKVVLAKEDVEEIRDSPQSIMPEGQLDSLSREQVRDLFGYLAGKKQVPLPAEKK